MLADFEVEARKQLGARDPENWPVLATALALDCSIWTEDTDFFGCGVATWTSGSIEIFLLTWSSVGPETLRIQLRRPQPKHHSEPLAELRKLFVLPKRCLHCKTNGRGNAAAARAIGALESFSRLQAKLRIQPHRARS